VVNYVLKKPSPTDREAIDKASSQSLAALPQFLAGDMAKALALVHAQPPRPKPPRPAAAALPVAVNAAATSSAISTAISSATSSAITTPKDTPPNKETP
jgi:peptidyl-tRNA hydrolase, PTH1 family